MSSIKTTQTDGDVSVGRNVAVGGSATIQGDAHIKGGVKVDGWFEAKNIKATNKGLFTTIEKLREAYPLPHEGWWAIVGNTLPGSIYVVDAGKWIPTGETGGSPTIESERYASSIAELEASMTTAKADISGHTEKIKTIEKQSSEQRVIVNQVSADSTRAKELATSLQTQLNTIVGGNASEAIDNFNEVIKFLARVKDNETLNALLEALKDSRDFRDLNERLIALERTKPSTDVLEVLEFDGFTSGAVTPAPESAPDSAKILFDAINKRFVAKYNDEEHYSASWILRRDEEYIFSAAGIYQTEGSNPRPFAKKIYVNRANNTLYRWNGEELIKVGGNEDASSRETALRDITNRLDTEVSNRTQALSDVNSTIETLRNSVNNIVDANTNEALENFNKVKNLLKDIKDNETLKTLLAKLNEPKEQKVTDKITLTSDIFSPGYYDNLGKTIERNENYSCFKINVEKYRGSLLQANYNNLTGRSGFIDASNNVSSFDLSKGVTIPDTAVEMFVTIQANLNDLIFNILKKVDLDEYMNKKADVDNIVNNEVLEKTKETDVKNGYIDFNGRPQSGGYHIWVDCREFRGSFIEFMPAYGGSSITGFKLENGTFKNLTTNPKKSFRYKIPEDAIEAIESFSSTSLEKERYFTFITKRKSLSDMISKKDAEQTFVSKEVFKSTLRTNPAENVIGYISSNNSLNTRAGYHAIRIDVKSYRGGKAIINKPYASGGVSTTGFVLENKELVWVKDIFIGKKNSLSIPENAVTLWTTWADSITSLEEQFIELEKYDYEVATKGYTDATFNRCLEESKRSTDERLTDLGISKLPPNTLWYVLGDSITAASVGKGYHYYELIASRNNLEVDKNCISVASDGARVTYSTEYGGTQLSKISTINERATLITLLLGINDFQNNLPLGTCWRVEGKELIDIPTRIEDCTDFSKAVVYMIYNLIKRCPKATIVWILPLRKRGVRVNNNGNYLEDFWKVITDVCEYFSCAVIKIAKESTLLNPNNENSGAFGDSVHPNKLGNLIMSYLIENQLSLFVPNKQSIISTILRGSIVDAKDNIVDISLNFTSPTGVVVSSPAGYNGNFSVELESDVRYTISSNGYTITPNTIKIESSKEQKIIASKD